MADDADRFERNERLFGKEGQSKLRQARAAVVGGGGLGLHVVQQVAFLGVGGISVVEPEELSETNRNRYIGSLSTDPVPGTAKVEIAARLVKGIDPSIVFRGVHAAFPSPEALEAVREADFVFGCFDHDGPRFILNETCLAYEKPLFDLATDVPEAGVYGGRVSVVWGARGCLHCRGVLDPIDVRRYISPREALENEAAVYGVELKHLGETGPSVVSLNGVVASLAVTEFMVAVTGMREPNLHLEYRAHIGTVNRRTDVPPSGCYYCDSVRGSGDRADIARYFPLTARKGAEKEDSNEQAAEVHPKQG